AREAAVGEQGAALAQTLGFEIAGRVQHFLHARPALGPLVADHHDIASLDLVAEDGLHRRVLAFVDAGAAFEHVDRFVHARGLHHAGVGRDVAAQDRQPAIAGIGVPDAADAAAG